MKKYLWLGSILLLLISGLAFVSSDADARKKDKSRVSGAIDAKSFKILTKAQELTRDGKYAEAIEALDKLKNKTSLSGYARSQIWNFYAYIHAIQEKYREAIGLYKKILAEPEAPEGLRLTAKYTLAQLYFQTEDYISVISLMEEWLEQTAKPTSTAYIILAQSYYQKKSYDAALQNLNKAIDITKQSNQPIKENWLRMKAAIYYEKQDEKNTLKTYQELLRRFPRVSYMRQIAGLYGLSGRDRERLQIYDAIHTKGALKKEAEILNLAYMYLGQQIPYNAARIIEKGMRQGVVKRNPKNSEVLANSWAQANEHKKAIPALKEAAELSDKGLLYARLAGVYFDAGDFKKAAEAGRRANRKGGLKRKGNNHMLVGMALFNIKDYSGALQSFRQAKQSKKNFNNARKWEQYTLGEIERIKILEANQLELVEKTTKTLEEDQSDAEKISEDIRDSKIIKGRKTSSENNQ